MSVQFGVQDDMHFTMRLSSSVAPSNAVSGRGVKCITALTKAEYDALETYAADTLYLVRQTDGTFLLYLGSAALWQDTDFVRGDGIDTVASKTRAQYEALDPPDPSTLYVLRDEAGT